jgi:hypothetical protein
MSAVGSKQTLGTKVLNAFLFFLCRPAMPGLAERDRLNSRAITDIHDVTHPVRSNHNLYSRIWKFAIWHSLSEKSKLIYGLQAFKDALPREASHVAPYACMED